jgi:hypothetical protein
MESHPALSTISQAITYENCGAFCSAVRLLSSSHIDIDRSDPNDLYEFMTRSRTVRRQAERDAQKLADAKWKLTLLEPGIRKDRPLVVESASQIEPHVRGMECPVCAVGFQVAEHVATPEGRTVQARCPQCGKTPSVYFVLRAASVN